jgi:tRNA(Arg) A34 adenosine deaminase TadA
MKKFVRVLIIMLLVLGGAFLLFHPMIHQIKGREDVEVLNSHWLRQIASKSLETDDLPISAILYFEDEVIGEGNHSVLKDGDPTGHAVINALRDASSSMGYENFQKLDREELKLITTYEPCDMCKGALINNDIKNVKFMMSKKFSIFWREYKKGIGYEMEKKNAGREYIQDSLFVIHPKYPFVP